MDEYCNICGAWVRKRKGESCIFCQIWEYRLIDFMRNPYTGGDLTNQTWNYERFEIHKKYHDLPVPGIIIDNKE